jgi:galactose-1-phosphate uridylyltransferase
MTRSAISTPEMKRAKGQRIEMHEQTMVFVNDYVAVLPPPNPIGPVAPHPILTTQPVDGQCDVLAFHPGHDLTLVSLPFSAYRSYHGRMDCCVQAPWSPTCANL